LTAHSVKLMDKLYL